MGPGIMGPGIMVFNIRSPPDDRNRGPPKKGQTEISGGTKPASLLYVETYPVVHVFKNHVGVPSANGS